ncbi:MAG: DEAD/DEAH box helicase [Myxococcota bacterium]
MLLDAEVPARDARFASMPDELPLPIREALALRGLKRLYSHQVEAFQRAISREHIVVATPTASGKSLCYNLPVLTELHREPSSRSMYLFPTKALSRDQESALHSLLRECKMQSGAITYDGDTPPDARRTARDRTSILLTNPDMLHAGILPHHADWARFFANLRYVVLDELHSYRGVFGSHLANVLRRLCRIAEFHGSRPTFIFASATIGNPDDHASRMLGAPVSLVAESGAPTGPRHVVVYNPPIVNSELGLRASYLKTSVNVVAELLRHEVPTLLFGPSRNAVEVMLKYLRDRLGRDGIDPERIHAYRGGYLPKTRRRIEASLRSGEVLCVVATSALELGIDIGMLDAVVCAGYPGSTAALFQRFGRAGRRTAPSLAVLVPSSAPMDQYIARDARSLLSAPIEQARIDPDNVEILIQHLKCSSFELPFREGEGFGNLPLKSISDVLGFLSQHGVVHPAAASDGVKVYHWSTNAYPANQVSLRSLSWDNFVVVDLDGDRTIAEMDWRSTHTMLHEQAIYQHEGSQYQVEVLDYENHKAFVRKVSPDYYTTAMTHTKVSVIEADEAEMLSEGGRYRLAIETGEVSIVEKVVGYKKIKFHSHENVGYGEVHLPEMQMHTLACWFVFPEALIEAQSAPRPVVVDAIRGLSTAMHTVAALGLMVDSRDLGCSLGDRQHPEQSPSSGHRSGQGFDPTVFLFDRVPGGVGLGPRLFDERTSLLRRTRQLIEGCECSIGCPGCVGPVDLLSPLSPDGPDSSMHRVDLKSLALALLADMGIDAVH